MAETRSPFWDFSLRVYRQPGVPDACLALQDAAGADVNIVLFLLWHAAEGRALEAADIAALEALVGDWRRQVVVPLREVRRVLKSREADPEAAALRRQVKQVELEAERLQQETLYREAASFGHCVPEPPTAARQNLSLYQHQLQSSFRPESVATLVAASLATSC